MLLNYAMKQHNPIHSNITKQVTIVVSIPLILLAATIEISSTVSKDTLQEMVKVIRATVLLVKQQQLAMIV
jgi:hypothetical protein